MIKEIWNTLTPSGKRSLSLSVTGFTLYALSGIAMMYIVLKALEVVISGSGNLLWYWVALVACLLIKGGSNILADVRKHYAGFDIVYQVRKNIIYRLKEFSLGFYTNERLGEISTIIHKDVDKMEMVVGHVWTRMLADFIVSAILLTALVVYSPKMALLMVSALPVAILFLVLGLKRAKRLEEEAGNDLADMVSVFVEYVKGIPLLKAFSESRRFEKKVEQTARDFGQSSKAVSRNRAAVLSVYGLIIDVSFWIMLTAGLLLLLTGKLPVYGFLLFAIISREFYKPFLALESHWVNYLTVTDSYRRIKKITEAETVPEPEMPIHPTEYAISFEDVSFSYEEGGFTMKDISFRTPAHTLTALVGGSGSGKTTITNLLLRFWDVTGGAIRIGGVDVRDMSYDELLGSVSIVMQNVQLFADTIEGNIRFGKAAATQEEIITAAKKARIHDFIVSLPDGYQTMIGENGVGLSGGQKQRISIARAFLKDAPILLLDEITSNVDPVNEALIQEAISELAKDRTVLVIAHHLSTIRSADQILVFQDGQIVQSGQHETLLSDSDGYYHKLWNARGSKEVSANEGLCG
ncbi:ABC transporter ATP-binding protein [[Clostridium] scindens]|uniref:ABC transporter ATP-binding protein n=1 Tax=Clostridium scindens (strain JCM 10418 / VPI 12708) TaxID=29347 RepID=UPI001D07ADDA|nr:ABC transporter ATP-binding protein [[Clostridium] scindens]MCB6284843.1 ABC transporter ATP-binding protein/permease [[Clostridium] scindens]MCB6419519.1 ABC transporter ATP-binding protein/permease [[Clostridium] scindens]MCB7191148.1 ABC transporter ATP-binding protein/permease [[Clostridium] scindens]MCB7284108.1 ABC transporter ATP-binding protein/permease [[Clostridium] scindens]MCG4927820.1 ABC transporter ATP-binding protein/permease [[Clostridium] scindens]